MKGDVANLDVAEVIDCVGNSPQKGRHISLTGTRRVALREVECRPPCRCVHHYKRAAPACDVEFSIRQGRVDDLPNKPFAAKECVVLVAQQMLRAGSEAYRRGGGSSVPRSRATAG